ncbi:hypothetical protein H4R18_004699 [Coemansia javaensis]|uniref:Uncharacterized protein n=1 Tax=Coemansia javaensis TaxID=2761396 RepID=A0A9W8H8P5_9FUNG|nr:hypothetical protein H4R18_004699 [Coemansia javaensis]
MAQGPGVGKKAAKGKSKGPQTLKKGRVAKAAKKQSLAQHSKLQKKLTANVTASLEQAMAAKAGAVGKLTILREAQSKGQSKETKRRKY